MREDSEYKKRRNQRKDELGSYVVILIERTFYYLQRSFRFFHSCRFFGYDKPHWVDRYMLFWTVCGIFLAIFAYLTWPDIPNFIAWPLRIFAIVRIINIIEATFNIGVFDQLGATEEDQKDGIQRVHHPIRSIVLLVINYIELMFWFGLIYLINTRNNLYGATHFYDAFYFSVITQLTIGYGDIHPISGITKTIVVIQSILGWLLTLLVLARFVSSMPKLRK